MKSRGPSPDPERSLTEVLEYGLTAVLVFVVMSALVEILGGHTIWFR